MLSKHTPEPWHAGLGNGEGSIFAESGRMRLETGGTTLYPIATICDGWEQEEDAGNLARIVACVNACKGFTTEALEKLSDGGFWDKLNSAKMESVAMYDACVQVLESLDRNLADDFLPETRAVLRNVVKDGGPSTKNRPGAIALINQLRNLLLEAGKERGRRHDGSYLPTFGPEGRFDSEELVALEEARLLLEDYW